MSLPSATSENIKSSLKELTRNVSRSLREDKRIDVDFKFKITSVQNAFSREFDQINFTSLSVNCAKKFESFDFYNWIDEEKALRIYKKAIPESLHVFSMNMIMECVSEGFVQYLENNRPEEEIHSFKLEILQEMANLNRDECYAYVDDQLPSEFYIDSKNPLLKKAGIDSFEEGDMFKVLLGSEKKTFKVLLGSEKKTYTITEVFPHIYTGKPTLRIERGIITAGGNGRFSMMD